MCGRFAITSRKERIETFTLLTTAANELTRPVHDRMPVIVKPEQYPLCLARPGRQGQGKARGVAAALRLRRHGHLPGQPSCQRPQKRGSRTHRAGREGWVNRE